MRLAFDLSRSTRSFALTCGLAAVAATRAIKGAAVFWPQSRADTVAGLATRAVEGAALGRRWTRPRRAIAWWLAAVERTVVLREYTVCAAVLVRGIASVKVARAIEGAMARRVVRLRFRTDLHAATVERAVLGPTRVVVTRRRPCIISDRAVERAVERAVRGLRARPRAGEATAVERPVVGLLGAFLERTDAVRAEVFGRRRLHRHERERADEQTGNKSLHVAWVLGWWGVLWTQEVEE